MLTLAPVRTLASAELKQNLHDIQDMLIVGGGDTGVQVGRPVTQVVANTPQ